MASWQTRTWQSAVASGVPRRDRASGAYRSYLPDLLTGAPLQLSAELDAQVASAERAVRSISGDVRDLVGVARFLLRSEAIASSRIEGIAPSLKQVALAELGRDEEIPTVSQLAQLVANNMITVEQARTELVASSTVSLSQIIKLHAELLPDQAALHGLRTSQNWIGGSSYTPIGAVFVPPVADQVESLMGDLLAYLNGAAHSPIVQAALVHAQFETIHPFADGNGRVGRALIQTVLTRRGLTPAAVLPVSLVLSTLRDDYLSGLTAYRHDGEVGSLAYHQARAAWIEVFTNAVQQAAAQAEALSAELLELRQEWNTRHDQWRQEQGFARALRTDSATALILRDLPGTPILSARTVERIHRVSSPAANKALAELASCGILTRTARGQTAFYQCDDVLDLVTFAERKLASTQFDTSTSAPNRPVPAARQRSQPKETTDD